LELVNLIDRQFPKWRSLYSGLMQGQFQGRRLYVVGYPQVALPGGNCGANVHLNADEVQFSKDLITYLNSVIKQAADQAGALYVDSSHTFDGHRLCEATGSQVAVNGLTMAASSHSVADTHGSFHPNALGHQLLADTVASQTDNLTKPMPAPAAQTNQLLADLNSPLLQNAPRSNRAIKDVNPHLNQLGALLQAGASLHFSLDTRSYFTKPNTAYSVAVGGQSPSTSLLNLGTFTADSNGTVNITASMPSTLPANLAGFQTVHIYGSDLFNNPVDWQQVVYVAQSAGDYDNDGVPNGSDACQFTAQSGTDVDKDGIDDACDPQIGNPPAPPSAPPEDIVWFNNSVLRLDMFTLHAPATSGP
jgi:hypothetical protein